MSMEEIELDQLLGNPKNPRTMSKHDAAALDTSIKEFGDLAGIVFNRQTKQLVGGHQRIEIFKRMKGDKKVVITQRFDAPDKVGTTALGYLIHDGKQYAFREVDWPLDRETAANIAANRIQGEFDLALLAEMDWWLKENAPDMLVLTGQTDDEISRLLDSVGGDENSEEDDAPELDEVNPSLSKLGEIYELGPHRLMCGSSTDLAQVQALLAGAKVDMVFTDPPYNAAFNGRSGNHDVIMNDELPDIEFDKFINEFVAVMYNVAPDGAKYICTDWKMYPLIYSLIQKPSALIVWVKNMFGMGNTYRHQHELIVFEGSLEANDKSDVWEIKRDNGAEYDRPTQKPVALPEEAIRNSSKRGGIVLDLFGGSGPTVVAADKLERIAYVMELDPKYCDVIRKRYAKHIGADDWLNATPIIETGHAE